MDIDYDTEMVGTVAVTEKDQLDLDSLTCWFEANVEGFEGPISYTKFKGGQSNRPIGSTRPVPPTCCAASRSASCSPAPTRSTANIRP